MDQTGIYNLALGHLGIGQAVGSVTEQSVPAITCTRFFDHCRQEVLRAFPWGHALRAEPLALIAGQVFPGWSYVYQYPNDCLKIRAIGDEGGIRAVRNHYLTDAADRVGQLRSPRIPWQTALRDDGARQVVLCDLAEAWAFHTTDVKNTGAYPSDFAGVLALRLATFIGGPLKAQAALIQNAKQEYLYWLSHAQADSLNESKDDERPESPSISCRG